MSHPLAIFWSNCKSREWLSLQCVFPLSCTDGPQLMLFTQTEVEEWISWALWKQTHLLSCCLLLHIGYKQYADSKILTGSAHYDKVFLAGGLSYMLIQCFGWLVSLWNKTSHSIFSGWLISGIQETKVNCAFLFFPASYLCRRSNFHLFRLTHFRLSALLYTEYLVNNAFLYCITVRSGTDCLVFHLV